MFTANILLYLNVYGYTKEREKQNARLEAYIGGATIWMLLLFTSTEILSLFQGINRTSLTLFWGVLDVLLVLLFLLKFKKNNAYKNIIRDIVQINLPAKNERFLLLIMLLVAGYVGILAVKTAPYNWDSMTYHMSRIAAWAQNGSVEHYATNIIRQIASPMLGEFVNLHVYVLLGKSDICINLLQCISYYTCAVMVYGIAGKIGCKQSFCRLASLLYMSMPIAFGEALTTQVDNFATVWLLFFVYLLLDFTQTGELIEWNRTNIRKVCIMGFCVAWGYLIKPSVCIAMVIFVLWLLVVCIRRKDKVGVLLRLILCTIPCIVLPIIPELARNISTFHAISSPIAGQRQLVGTLNPLALLVNFSKNFVINLPTVYLYDYARQFAKVPEILARLLRVDLNNPAISEDGRVYALSDAPNFGHDTAANPLIVWLLIFCIVLVIFKIKKMEWKKLLHSYSLIAVVSFLIFCTILRWEPFVTRYMLSYLTLLCPMLALQMQKLPEKGMSITCQNMWVGAICFVAIMNLASMCMYHRNVCNVDDADTRPYGYFVVRPQEYPAYLSIAQDIKAQGYSRVGIYLGENHYEYPFWAMLKDSDVEIEHVNVTNESAVYMDEIFVPETIIWIGNPPEGSFQWSGKEYSIYKEYAVDKYLLEMAH